MPKVERRRLPQARRVARTTGRPSASPRRGSAARVQVGAGEHGADAAAGERGRGGARGRASAADAAARAAEGSGAAERRERQQRVPRAPRAGARRGARSSSSSCREEELVTSYDDEVPVLIVGGSLVGLSTSLLLASKGVPSLPSSGTRARRSTRGRRCSTSARSRSTEASVSRRRSSRRPTSSSSRTARSSRSRASAGKELEYYFRNVNDGYESLSPSPRLFITQIGLEPILRRHADELGARLEYSTEFVSIDQDEDGVTAVVRSRDTGAERTVRAGYVIAADGSKSPVRERLGIPLAATRASRTASPSTSAPTSSRSSATAT